MEKWRAHSTFYYLLYAFVIYNHTYIRTGGIQTNMHALSHIFPSEKILIIIKMEMKMIMMMTMIVIDENHLGCNQRTSEFKYQQTFTHRHAQPIYKYISEPQIYVGLGKIWSC